MRTEGRRIVLALSCMALCLLWVPRRVMGLLAAAAAGLAVGLLWRPASQEKRERRIWIRVLSVLFSLAFLGFSALRFSRRWGEWDRLLALLQKLSVDPFPLLGILSALAALAALPFTERFLAALLHGLSADLSWRELWRIAAADCSGRGAWKKLLILALQLLGSILLGTALLLAAFSLPTAPIEANVASSAYIMEREGTFPKLYPFCTSGLDNFTDSLMLLEAAADTGDSALDRAMSAYRGRISDKDPRNSLTGHYCEGIPFDRITTYARYWHGYHIFLRPLLTVTNYRVIRVLNGIVQTLCAALICLLLKKNGKTRYILPYGIAWLMLMPLVMAKSMQFSACYYVFSAGLAALLLTKPERRGRCALFLFFQIGIAVAFFDFLTYPMATFGVPAVFFLMLSERDSLERKLVSLAENAAAWLAGYAGMWFSKWVLASLTTGSNVIANGMAAVGERTAASSAGGTVTYSALESLGYNLKAFLYTPVTLIALVFVIVLVFRLSRNRDLTPRRIFRTLLPYALLALAPIAWYMLVVNHSTIHSFFTNKALVVDVLAVCFGLLALREPPLAEN